MRLQLTLVAHAVLVVAVLVVAGVVADGNLLVVVPAGLLVSFIWVGVESKMTGALLCVAGLSLVSVSHGAAGTVGLALGGFVAAEVASHGSRLRQAAPITRLRGDTVVTASVVLAGAAASLATLAVGAAHIRPAASLAAMFVLAVLLLTVVVGAQLRER